MKPSLNVFDFVMSVLCEHEKAIDRQLSELELLTRRIDKLTEKLEGVAEKIEGIRRIKESD